MAQGSAYKAQLKVPRSMQVACHARRSRRVNNVTLDPDLKDAWGLPAIRVTYKDHPDDLANARFLQDRAPDPPGGGRLRSQAPVTESNFDAPPRHVPHGATGKPVVDKHHRSHDVRICSSAMAAAGDVWPGLPTMTIQALAFRAGNTSRFAKRGR
jgi:hypothetical protein